MATPGVKALYPSALGRVDEVSIRRFARPPCRICGQPMRRCTQGCEPEANCRYLVGTELLEIRVLERPGDLVNPPGGFRARHRLVAIPRAQSVAGGRRVSQGVQKMHYRKRLMKLQRQSEQFPFAVESDL